MSKEMRLSVDFANENKRMNSDIKKNFKNDEHQIAFNLNLPIMCSLLFKTETQISLVSFNM